MKAREDVYRRRALRFLQRAAKHADAGREGVAIAYRERASQLRTKANVRDPFHWEGEK